MLTAAPRHLRCRCHRRRCSQLLLLISRSRCSRTQRHSNPSRRCSRRCSNRAGDARTHATPLVALSIRAAVSSGSDGGDQEPDDVGRTKSLTDEDLEQLKGCLDLGFGFSYEEIPELCNTLPALELCYSMSQRFLDDQQQHRSLDRSSSGESLDLCESPPSPPIANWKISSPENPDEVKARLKYWAQAVACTIRLCS